MGITGTFAVRLSIVIYALGSGGNIWGRNSTLSGKNSTSYPERLNNNGAVQSGALSVGEGDVTEFLLVYDGTNYKAYMLNLRQ